MARAQELWKTGGIVKGVGIPAPSGQYRVGCVDLMHQLGGDDRGLLLRLHYPTEATPEAGCTYSSWCPSRRYIKGYLHMQKIKLAGFLSTVIGGLSAPKVPALERAPLFGSDGADESGDGVVGGGTAAAPVFPVILFSHGLGAMRTTYSSIVCDLASHGYVVACMEHRDGSAAVSRQRVPKPGGKEGELEDQWIEYQHFNYPTAKEDPVANAEAEFPVRNKQVKQRADEVKKSLDILTLLNEGAEIQDMLGGSYDFKQFKGRMDVSLAAVIGHSYGGGTTVQTLSEDTRFKCGLALDSWIIPIHPDIYSNSSSISQPLYFINSHNFQWRENMKRMLPLAKPLDANGMSPSRILTIIGTHHFNQCDIPFVLPRSIVNAAWKESVQTLLDSQTAHQVNMEICHAFLKRHLLKDPAYQQPTPNLDGTEEHSQHILFGTNIKMSDETPGSGGAADETPGSGGAADETPGSGGEERGEGDEVGSKREGEGLKEQVVAAKPNEVEKQDEDGANGEVIVKEEQLSQGDGQV